MLKNNKLLIICGPTSTGKTSLGLYLSKKFKGEIISADSRQVYKGMNIGTGKDLPPDSIFVQSDLDKTTGYYEMDGVKIWGYDLVSPKKEFSVAQYLKTAEKIINDIRKREKLPVVVGGTGLYIKAVVDGIETADVPKNEVLRKSLEVKSTSELYEQLSNLDPLKAASLNSSDSKNPRRLVRAIEVAQYRLQKKEVAPNKKHQDVLFIGLTLPDAMLKKLIRKRVYKRIDDGIIEEVGALLKNGVEWTDQSMDSFGYKEWRNFLEGKNDENEVIENWINDETSYVKKQLTWFKKESRINWFDASLSNYKENVEKLVQKWYF